MAIKIKEKETHYYIYRFLNKNDEVIYVGKTKLSLKKRILEHIKLKLLNEQQLSEVYKIQYVEIDNEFDWHLLEIFYINYFKAKYNKQFKINNDIDYSILNLSYFLEKYKWNDFINYEEFQTMIKNSNNLYNSRGFIKPQPASQLSQRQFNDVCVYLEKSKNKSDKINWLILNLLAYSKLNLQKLVMLKWCDISNLIKEEQIPKQLIVYYKTKINLNINENDYIFKSRKKSGFILPCNITNKIKILLKKFFNENYNTKSFQQLNEDYYVNKSNINNIIWLQ